MTGLDDLAGRTFGPFQVGVTPERVAAFVSATGDDPERWSDHAPPFFANTVLFAAASSFLEDPEVAPFTRSLIHSEQRYAWERALEVGETLEVAGVVESMRVRGALNLVSFAVEARSDRGGWSKGTSVFLMSDEAAATGEDEPEPGVFDRPEFGDPSALPLPGVGDSMAPFPCGASRLDLVRYAAATDDWNPIHWDHDFARQAGLPGTIVHGLLMAAWMGIAAARYRQGPVPFRSTRIRFRNPLRPAKAAVVSGTVDESDGGPDLDVVLASGDERLVTGRFEVTP